MTNKAKNGGFIFRPHFKTHQSATIGEWFREEGVEAITVSSLRMGNYFLDHGWTDQTVAFPFDPNSTRMASELAKRGKFRFTVSEGSPVERMDRGFEAEAGLMVEIDSGDQRSGFDPRFPERIDEMLERIRGCERLHFEGFLLHSGHSYQLRDGKGIEVLHEREMEILGQLRERFRSEAPLMSVGDTPTASLMEDFPEADELRPGNFIFYDLMQERIGSCGIENIAVCMACPIVSKDPERRELVLHGGAVHFSLDRLHFDDGTPYFGLPVPWTGDGWNSPYPDSWVRRLSQEHGIVRCSEELFREKEVGDTLGILPVHSCLTADAMKGYRTLGGEEFETCGG